MDNEMDNDIFIYLNTSFQYLKISYISGSYIIYIFRYK